MTIITYYHADYMWIFVLVIILYSASCDKGYHLDHESAGCEECPSDWYQPYDPDNGILVQDVCVACPTGRKTRQTAAFGKLEDVCEGLCLTLDS